MLHAGVVRKVLFRAERWCVFSLLGDRRTREKLWCVCPLGTLLLGLQEAPLHLSVCVCVCVCVSCVSPRTVGVARREGREVAASLVFATESPLPASE